MHLNQLETLKGNNLTFNYLPAVLKKYSTGWMVEYWCEDPNEGAMKRVRIRVDRIRKRYARVAEANAHIAKIVLDLNMRLVNGWNPFVHEENARSYSSFDSVVDAYIKEKEKELRPDTMRCYRSFTSTFLNFVHKRCPINFYSGNFNRQHASRLMDYIYNERGVSQRSYNNYLKFFRTFFNWCLEKCYVSSNPFVHLKPKQKTNKKRGIIDAATRKVIVNYLSEHDPYFLVVCKLMYYSLIRPKEILSLKVGDVDLDRKSIFVSAGNAKNHHARFAAITPDLASALEYVRKYPKDMWLVSQSMSPSHVKAHRAKLSKKWILLREKLHLPDEMQLYSFRDTGIYDMMKEGGLDPLTVKQHADHHSLEMTTIYSDHADPELTAKIYNCGLKF